MYDPGGRCQWLTPVILTDQEDCGLRPALANSSEDSILKIPNIKEGWWSGSSGTAL
jgi:hypothetical protein